MTQRPKALKPQPETEPARQNKTYGKQQSFLPEEVHMYICPYTLRDLMNVTCSDSINSPLVLTLRNKGGKGTKMFLTGLCVTVRKMEKKINMLQKE